MPLPMKTLREAAAELNMPESEIKTLVDLHKVRAIFKKGKLLFAPDELAKIKRLRKSLPESALKSAAAERLAETPPPPPKVPPKRPQPAPIPLRRVQPPRRFET